MSTSPAPAAREVHLSVEVEVDDVRQDWARCNLLANYVADYSAYLFGSVDKAENLISTVSNEVIEACVRSSPPGTTLTFGISCTADLISFQCGFSPSGPVGTPLDKAIQDLTGGEARAAYLDLLSSPLADDTAAIRLSVAMLMHDFGACFQYQHKPGTGHLLQVQVPAEDLAP